MRRTAMIFVLFYLVVTGFAWANPPIYISFLWHMHQPIYVPYEPPTGTIPNNGPAGGPAYSWNLAEMWLEKGGPYREWPIDAVEAGVAAGLDRLGAQVTLSGSLIESLLDLEAADWRGGFYAGWREGWIEAMDLTTAGGNRRMDVVNFPYHHALGGLMDVEDLALQIRQHQQRFSDAFGRAPSIGFFPTESSFHTRMIPALVEAGIQWTIVDSIHLDRTLDDYPWNGQSGVYQPNSAEKAGYGLGAVDPGGSWVYLDGIDAPEPVSAWSHRPHYVEHVDPATGGSSRIIAVPAATYIGYRDSYGGFGPLDYEAVMSQLEAVNTDAAHPVLLVLHHDGENWGGGSENYYHYNFNNFIDWCLEHPGRFVPTTIQDYLDQFPPANGDVVHIEPGGWIGSACLDPEFHYWLGDPEPFPSGYSPDWNSWATITAARNWVATANAIMPGNNAAAIVYDSGNATEQAWHDLMCAETSCFEYWEGTTDEALWNSNPTRACNLAIEHIEAVVEGGGDTVGPTIFKPQRQPYNPGAYEFGEAQPAECMAWSFIHDLSGIAWAQLRYRIDDDPRVDHENRIYDGGTWTTVYMNGGERPSQSMIPPRAKAPFFSGWITGVEERLVDYYILARDVHGNERRSEIDHVYVGWSGATSPVSWSPLNPGRNEPVTITVRNPGVGGSLHWGVTLGTRTWRQPDQRYWPAGSQLYQGGPSVESPLDGPDASGDYSITIGPFNQPGQTPLQIDFVIHYANDDWDNNGGADYHIAITEGGSAPTPTPTPGGDLQVQLTLNQQTYGPDDPFLLTRTLTNQTETARAVDFYLLLDVFGQYFFSPAWTEQTAGRRIELDPFGESTATELEFTMPYPLPSGGPFGFWAAMFLPDTFDLASNVAHIEFSLTSGPG